jgi:hypothetical protein
VPTQMTDKEIEEWENGRDLLAEIDADVEDLVAGRTVLATHSVEVSAEVHELRTRPTT